MIWSEPVRTEKVGEGEFDRPSTRQAFPLRGSVPSDAIVRGLFKSGDRCGTQALTRGGRRWAGAAAMPDTDLTEDVIRPCSAPRSSLVTPAYRIEIAGKPSRRMMCRDQAPDLRARRARKLAPIFE
jgi:hypothetical protein